LAVGLAGPLANSQKQVCKSGAKVGAKIVFQTLSLVFDGGGVDFFIFLGHCCDFGRGLLLFVGLFFW
jgi:hypothetical protein